MKVQKTNFVDQVLCNAKVSMNSTIGSVTKPGAIAEYAGNCVANAELISKIAENAQQSASPQNAVSLDIKTPSMMPSILGGGAVMALTAINPIMGAGAAAIMAVGEAISFATGHAGVKGSMPQGELTMAAANKQSYAESHPHQDVYADTSGDSYNVSTGQKQAPVAQSQPMAALDRKLASATQETVGDYSPEQISGDIKSMLGEQQKNYAWAQNKLELLGVKDTNTPSTLDIAAMDMKAIEPKKSANFVIPALG